MTKHTTPSDLAVWVSRMGLRGAKFSQATQMIGMAGPSVASRVNSGKRSLTVTERLAMSALRAGLQPWTPEYDDEQKAAWPAPRGAIAS